MVWLLPRSASFQRLPRSRLLVLLAATLVLQVDRFRMLYVLKDTFKQFSGEVSVALAAGDCLLALLPPGTSPRPCSSVSTRGPP
jgi:hypothetical protein